MFRPIARLALVIATLAAGHAAVSTAHEPATPVRTCGSFHDKDGQPVGVVIERGRPSCATARKVLRTYFRSDKPCEGSACARKHFGWKCLSAKGAFAWPRLGSCSKGKSRVAAFAPAD